MGLRKDTNFCLQDCVFDKDLTSTIPFFLGSITSNHTSKNNCKETVK